MCHKNDNPNLTQESSGLLKGVEVKLYLISLTVSIHGKSLSRLFSGNLPAMFL